MVTAPRATILDAALADRHEQRNPTCLLAADGTTCCPHPATHRVELAPIVGVAPGPATFTCTDHVALWIGHPAIDSIREVQHVTKQPHTPRVENDAP